jgi:ribosomal protein L28
MMLGTIFPFKSEGQRRFYPTFLAQVLSARGGQMDCLKVSAAGMRTIDKKGCQHV